MMKAECEKSACDQNDRRNRERKHLTAPVKATFSMDIDGLIDDISPEGMAIRFNSTDR